MQLAQAQAIVKELVEYEGIQARVDPKYSGRGMWGRTTAAVITRWKEDVFCAAGVLGLKFRRSEIRVDQLGKDMVVY